MTRIIAVLFIAVAACLTCAAQDVRDSLKVSTHDNFHTTHYLFMPNGFGLKRGEAYYQNILVLGNQFSVGVTKHISLGLGTVPVYLFGGDVFPFWVAPKISLPLGPRVSLGGGVMSVFVYYAGNGDDVIGGWERGGLAYGALTMGTRDRNTSIGVGYGIRRGGVSERPVLTISNMTRINRRAYLLTENYIFVSSDDSFGTVSFAGRVLFNRLSLDFGGATPIGVDRFLLIPWLGFSVPLGKPHYVE